MHIRPFPILFGYHNTEKCFRKASKTLNSQQLSGLLISLPQFPWVHFSVASSVCYCAVTHLSFLFFEAQIFMSQQRISVGLHYFVTLLPIYFKTIPNREQNEKTQTIQNTNQKQKCWWTICKWISFLSFLFHPFFISISAKPNLKSLLHHLGCTTHIQALSFISCFLGGTWVDTLKSGTSFSAWKTGNSVWESVFLRGNITREKKESTAGISGEAFHR